MNLDSLNIFTKGLNIKENARPFMKELSNYLENIKTKRLNNQTGEISIIEQIESNNKLTTGNKNSIIWKENNIILKYAKQNFNNKTIYFVKDSKKTYWLNNEKYYDNEVYKVLKIQNNKIQEIEMSKNDMPNDIGVNDVFRKENGKYMLDNIATKELKEEITKMAEEIIAKQNRNLEKHRREGHLYIVTEEVGSNRFLKDINNYSKSEFEEVNIPKELLEKATEGIVLKYTNGKYEYYSEDEYKLE